MFASLPCWRAIERSRNNHAIKEFYSYQKYIEERRREDEELLRTDHAIHMEETTAKEERNQKIDAYLAKITITINVVMIIAKATAAYFSHSISVVSTVVDSVMDVTSGVVIWGAVRAIDKTNSYDYPVGRSRLEPLAVLVVAIVMVIANLIVIGESALSIVNHTLDPFVDLKTLIILSVGAFLKMVLFVICKKHNTVSSNVLAQDQRNDVATNLVALAGAYIGHRFWVYADSIGAFLVCGFIVISWVLTASEQIPLLVGKSASPEFISRITNIAVNHDARVKALDTVYVYHMGANYLVELHVLMDEDLSLRDAHDVSEELQVKIERMPYVDRAFVHVDYKMDGDEHLSAKKYK
uniref:ZT_dimer domain-containing protein n=1 Tax=Steinernema glaseri TaxID=37863 RepID=A0A1I8AW06_9BILA